MTRNWLQAIWAQLFKNETVVQPREYLQGNFTIGLFLIIVLVAGAGDPERLPFLPAWAVGLAVVGLVGGYPLAALARRKESSIVFAQALILGAALVTLVCMSVWLGCRDAPLSNFRYLPGLALCLFVYASLQVDFMGPPSWRALRPRRMGVALGLVSELAMAACLLRRLAHS